MLAPRGFRCRTALRVEADSDKALVMADLRGLVADGLAEWRTLDDGANRFSLNTGETYLLKTMTIARIA